jgi:transposase-like protein
MLRYADFLADNTMAKQQTEFKHKHFTGDVILWAVRWYCQFAISYRDLVIMAAERGLEISHTTPMRWVHEYAPKLAKKIKPHLKQSNDSYRLDGLLNRSKFNHNC